MELARMDSNFIQKLYETQCKQDYKPQTDYRLYPVVLEMHTLNCLKTIELGLQLCKEKIEDTNASK